jgi:hypothetical protein
LLNPQAPGGPRCVYYDVKSNQLSDQGIITRYNTQTGRIECDTYHLTDFSIIEYDVNGLKPTVMTPNLEKKDVFKPLNMVSTTPVVLMIVFSVILGVLIPLSLVLDSIGSDSAKKEQHIDPSKREKTLTDVMFFNKFEERNKPQYATANLSETNADEADNI